jgi:hypothetical protein
LQVLAEHRGKNPVRDAGFAQGNNFRSAEVVAATGSLDEHHDDFLGNLGPGQLQDVLGTARHWCHGLRFGRCGTGRDGGGGFSLRGDLRAGQQGECRYCNSQLGKAWGIHKSAFPSCVKLSECRPFVKLALWLHGNNALNPLNPKKLVTAHGCDGKTIPC